MRHRHFQHNHHKVNRCLAPQPLTNQPTGHQISRQGLYVPKKAYFGAKIAVFGPTYSLYLDGRAWHLMDHIGQYLAQNDQKCILAFFGPNILIILEAKVLVPTYQTTIYAPRSHFILSGMAPNGQELSIFGQKWPKMHIFGQMWPCLCQKS